MMQAEIIAIGDELTSGQRVDTNSQWLSQRLGEIGIRTLYHTTVADDLVANMEAFRQAVKRAEVVITTGGLGPTADDLTRQSIAAAFDLPLELDEASLRHIEHLFQSRGREMPEQNRIQAMFPQSSQVIPNPHGTAPGIDLVRHSAECKSRIFALPGVPAEMKEMWELHVRPALLRDLGANVQVVHHHRIKCFGVGESALEAMLPDLIVRGREPSVGITVSKATITLRVTTQGPSIDACRDSMEPTIATIRQCLGELIFGEEDDELQHVVVRALRAEGQKLAVCESATEGLAACGGRLRPGRRRCDRHGGSGGGSPTLRSRSKSGDGRTC
jgi:nicotinamide-nucleotide amidase